MTGWPHVVPELAGRLPEMQALRRDLHAHPELSYQEFRTSNLVAARLQACGIRVRRGLAGTGVVGSLQRGTSARSIGLRADMDALPLQEANRFEHASRHVGVMHACGHDGHTAMLLGAAEHLAQHGRFDGTVHFIFQPAEEQGAGAQRMLDEGLFDHHPCDEIFALHNWPGMAVGHFGVRSGSMMAGTAGLEITVTGCPAHAAMPHAGVDALMVACHIAIGAQMLITRERNPLDAAVLTITQLHAGETMNVVAAKAALRGTLRFFDPTVLDRLEEGLCRVSTLTAEAHRASAHCAVQRNYPPLVNHAGPTCFAASTMAALVGADRVNTDVSPTMAAEDFAYLLRARPGCFAFIGNGLADARLPDHGDGPCLLHSDSYDFNDELLPLGASYFVRLVETRLASSPGETTP